MLQHVSSAFSCADMTRRDIFERVLVGSSIMRVRFDLRNILSSYKKWNNSAFFDVELSVSKARSWGFSAYIFNLLHWNSPMTTSSRRDLFIQKIYAQFSVYVVCRLHQQKNNARSISNFIMKSQSFFTRFVVVSCICGLVWKYLF